jgi:hypothetical protein
VASQDPTADGVGPYEQGWVALADALQRGSSWSGSERNCAYLNLGDGSFVDVSAVMGLDQVGDGRAMLTTDWDGDGDLDVVLKNRTGPQLQVLAAMGDPGDRFLEVELVGTRSNRDSVGARLVLQTSLGMHAREVAAGDGYLSQSSLRQHFGLQSGEVVQSLKVRWPGSTWQVVEGLAAGGRYRVVEGEALALALDRPRLQIEPRAFEPASAPPSRVVLRTPMPLPPNLQRSLFDGLPKGQARLIDLWSESCAPCLRELGEFAAAGRELAEAGVTIVPLCVDPPEKLEVAHAVFMGIVRPQSPAGTPQLTTRAPSDAESIALEVLLGHALDMEGRTPLPTSLLVDRRGWLQVIYLGPVTPDQLQQDVARYGLEPPPGSQRGAWPGRWFFGVPRDLEDLARRLTERGLEPEARFYRTLDRNRRGGDR